MKKHFDTLIQLGVIAILVVAAATKQHYNIIFLFVTLSLLLLSIGHISQENYTYQ